MIKKNKDSKLKICFENIDLTGNNSKKSFINFFNKLIEKVDVQSLLENYPSLVKKDSTLFPSYIRGIHKIGNIYLSTHSNTKMKKEIIKKIIKKYSLNCEVSVNEINQITHI